MCAQHDPKGAKVVPPMLHIRYKSEVFDVVAAGLRQLPRAESGSAQWLLAVDMFSKYTIAKALPDKTAPTVVDAILTTVLMAHGSAKVMLSYNGGEFKSQVTKEALRVFNTEPRYTAP